MTDDQATAVHELGTASLNGSASERVANQQENSDSSSKWEEFLSWGRRHYEWSGFEDTEQAYKLKLVAQLQSGKAALFGGRDDWFDLVKRSLTGDAHPVHWTNADDFIKWCGAYPKAAKNALLVLWDESAEPVDRVQRFDEALPREAAQSRGSRMSLISFLHMAMDPCEFPPYRVEPIHTAFRLTGFKPLHWQAPIVEQYMEFLGFLDLLIAEAANRGMKVKHRLDAQGIIWTVVKWGPSEYWPEADQRAMCEYLGRKYKAQDESSGDEEVQPLTESSSLSDLADRLLIDVEYLEEIQSLLTAKGQAIFYGPPGTGKTFIARELARVFAANPDDPEEDGLVEIVQFHPSYAYEDFVEGYRPRKGGDGEGMVFELVEGPLKRIAREAAERPETTHVLIIDEINRGNVAKVLGELYFLLEYRNEPIQLQYSEEKFKLPENLWIIGTMNTADRSIALIDAALRRRFYFVGFFPDKPPIEGLLRRWLQREQSEMLWVADVLDRANAELEEHGAIGPSYFMKDDLDEDWVKRIWEHAVLPYLAEQFFGEEERLDSFQLDRLRGLDSEPAGDDALSESE